MIHVLLILLFFVNACSGYSLTNQRSSDIRENKIVLFEVGVSETNGTYIPLQILFMNGNRSLMHLEMAKFPDNKPSQQWSIRKHVHFHTEGSVMPAIIPQGDLMYLPNVDVHRVRFRFKLVSKKLRIWEGKDFIGDVEADFKNDNINKFGIESRELSGAHVYKKKEYSTPRPYPATIRLPRHMRLERYNKCEGVHCRGELGGGGGPGQRNCSNVANKVHECYAHLNLIILLKDVVESFEIQVHSTEVNGTSRQIYEFSLDPFSSHTKFLEFDQFSDNPNMRASASDYEESAIIEISFEMYKKYLIIYRRIAYGTIVYWYPLRIDETIGKINLFGDGAEILEAVNGQQHWARAARAAKFRE